MGKMKVFHRCHLRPPRRVLLGKKTTAGVPVHGGGPDEESEAKGEKEQKGEKTTGGKNRGHSNKLKGVWTFGIPGKSLVSNDPPLQGKLFCGRKSIRGNGAKGISQKGGGFEARRKAYVRKVPVSGPK